MQERRRRLAANTTHVRNRTAGEIRRTSAARHCHTWAVALWWTATSSVRRRVHTYLCEWKDSWRARRSSVARHQNQRGTRVRCLLLAASLLTGCITAPRQATTSQSTVESEAASMVAGSPFPSLTTQSASPQNNRASPADTAAACHVRTSSAPPNTTTVQVYFTCNNESLAVPRYVPNTSDTSRLLRAALDALVAGPTKAEQAAGFSSFFSAGSATIINDVTMPEPTSAVVDVSGAARAIPNASTSNGGRTIMSQLSRTLFQFPEIETVTFQMDGSCDAFWHWLGSTCQQVRGPTSN